MNDIEIDSAARGTTIKITSWNPSTKRLYAVDLREQVCSFTCSEDNVFREGQVVLWDQESNRLIHDDNISFNEPTEILIVRDVRKNGVIVENGISIAWKDYSGDLTLKPGNTIKYGLISHQVEVLSDSPIRSKELSGGEADSSQFRKKIDKKLVYEDFAGSPDLVDEVKTLFETQLNKTKRDLLEKIGVKPLKGVLFSGPPGTGKTLLARIIASQTGVAFYLVNGPEVLEKFVGSTEKVLRDIFQSASDEPNGAIIFFDEIDTLASQRGENNRLPGQGQLVGQLLTLMDGFNQDNKVIVIGATNRVADLDLALRRPGRFDRIIEFSLPSYEDRQQILEMNMRHKSTNDDIPTMFLSANTEGFSPAELTGLCDEAGLIAASENRSRIWAEDAMRAYYRVAAQHKRQMEVNNK